MRADVATSRRLHSFGVVRFAKLTNKTNLNSSGSTRFTLTAHSSVSYTTPVRNRARPGRLHIIRRRACSNRQPSLLDESVSHLRSTHDRLVTIPWRDAAGAGARARNG